ncbi:MAG: hypothetical protein QOH31_6769 [Verrucomicrobiota bacterium]|jgi:hypothetical protein
MFVLENLGREEAQEDAQRSPPDSEDLFDRLAWWLMG